MLASTAPSLRPSKRSNTNGFTIVEIVVAITVSVVLLIGIGALFLPTLATTIENTDETDTYRALDVALSDIQQDITTAHGFLKKQPTATPDNDTGSASPAWISGEGASKRALMLPIAMTTKSKADESRQLVYISSGDCDAARQVAYATVVYFVDAQSRLVRRTLTPSLTNSCWGRIAFEKTSCTNGAGAVAGCGQKDIIVAEEVRSFTIDYFSDLTIETEVAPTSIYTDTQNDIMQTVTAAKVTLELNYSNDDPSSNSISKSAVAVPLQSREEAHESTE